jgi:AcrR family transcriptional regulator
VVAGTRREAQKAETKRIVLDAAYALFEERGWEETTMRAVAGRARVALGTIFLHFPDKRALLLAAFETDLGRVIADAFATLPQGPLRERLLHVAARLYAFYGERPRLARVLVQQALFAEGREGALLADQVRAFLSRIAGLFDEAAGRGEVDPGVSAGDAALGFWADYFLALVAGLQNGVAGAPGQVRLLRRLIDLRLAGLGRRRRGRDGRRR